MQALIGSLLIIAGVAFHVLTLATGTTFIVECLRFRSFQRRSAFPLWGPVLVSVGYGLVPVTGYLWLVAIPWALEAFVLVISFGVHRATKSLPRTPLSGRGGPHNSVVGPMDAPAPDASRVPMFVPELTMVELVYSDDQQIRVAITKDPRGIYRIHPERWDVSDLTGFGRAFWSQWGHASLTDELEIAREMAQEALRTVPRSRNVV